MIQGRGGACAAREDRSRSTPLKIAYVLDNLVRAGLVSDWRDDPFAYPRD